MAVASLDELPVLGGRLCLDFVNTIDPRYGPVRIDYLPDYRSLVAWAGKMGICPESEQAMLLEEAVNQPGAARAVHGRARELRRDLYALLRSPRAADVRLPLRRFNTEVRAAGRHVAVVECERGYELAWTDGGNLDRVLWRIVRSAAELMASPRELDRVRECDGRNCGWLFVDTSKAGRRRWCSMEICGNRAKAQRHRNRR